MNSGDPYMPTDSCGPFIRGREPPARIVSRGSLALPSAPTFEDIRSPTKILTCLETGDRELRPVAGGMLVRLIRQRLADPATGQIAGQHEVGASRLANGQIDSRVTNMVSVH